MKILAGASLIWRICGSHGGEGGEQTLSSPHPRDLQIPLWNLGWVGMSPQLLHPQGILNI